MMKTNMNKPRWWLYCQDLEFARRKQWEIALNETDSEKQANEIAVMTYLGIYSECEEQILRLNLTEYKQGREALYRARRALGGVNTWESLISKNISIETTIDEIDKAINNNEIICVNLVGGIGDQLEATSLLLGHTERHKAENGPRIEVRACGANNNEVDKYLKKTSASKFKACRQSFNKLEISYPVYRYWHEKRSDIPLQYNTMYDISKKREVMSEKLNLLVCWRCKINKDNLISTFTRSIPFNTIMEQMNNIKNEIEDELVRVVDITKYNCEEKKIISRNYPKITLVGDDIRSIGYLIKQISHSDKIISVDTSLIHISATCNRKVNALLPQYADERWLELMQSEGVYKNNVIIHRQKTFNNWGSKSISTLNNIIQNREDKIT